MLTSASAVVFFEWEPFPPSLVKLSLYISVYYLPMNENSKKNKKGAQGSTNEEANEPKRPCKTSKNMAEEDSEGLEEYVGGFAGLSEQHGALRQKRMSNVFLNCKSEQLE